MITPEQVQTIINGTKSVAEVLANVSSELVAESLNLFLVSSLLSILKFSGVFLLYLILRKYLGYLKESNNTTEPIYKGINLFILITSMLYFFSSSYSHIETIVKIQVAPKLFLLEKVNDIAGLVNSKKVDKNESK